MKYGLLVFVTLNLCIFGSNAAQFYAGSNFNTTPMTILSGSFLMIMQTMTSFNPFL